MEWENKLGFNKLSLIKHSLRKLYDIHVKQDRKVIAYHEYLEKGGEALRLDYPLENEAIVWMLADIMVILPLKLYANMIAGLTCLSR